MALDFSLTPEQEEIRALAHELAIGASAAFPTEYGGGGVDFITELLLQEELSWGDAGMAVAIQASGLAGAGIIAMGTDEQKDKYIGMLCDSRELHLAAMGLTEP